MPDSPDTKNASTTAASPATSLAPSMGQMTRSLSTGSSNSGMNGSHSPHSSVNGRTPSPPAVGNSASMQQLPPACGARQLSKLKRFLTTLQQFGSDISPEIGERVRSLVLGLVNSHLSIEEFHSKLQEATNFPLRPFVIPFLKANLPLLQRELLHCARVAKQTPQQYLAHNEHILLDTSHSPTESQDIITDINENGKRRASPDRPKENGTDTASMEPMNPAKRPHTISPANSTHISPNTNFLNSGPIRLEDISLSRELRERERLERERFERDRLDRDRDRHFGGTYGDFRQTFQRPDGLECRLDRIDDDWKHVDTMLHCIIDMVGKTKRALSVLQERSMKDRDELSLWMRRHAEGLDQDMKKRTNEMMAHTMRTTEDRVCEVKRRAEEAVNEVKRQAVSELQKAVAAAEQKASELVSAEKKKMEAQVQEARKLAQEDIRSINQQEESNESCWNCGRKASETCSGCNIARYCGAFCQHRDWENHHRVCGPSATRESLMTAKSTENSPHATTTTSVTTSSGQQGAARSSPVMVSSPTTSTATRPDSRSASQSGSRPNSPPSESKSSEHDR
ncbi:unnamed protein product [Owenia fusiformis]|uniref:Uncharacterized protein n=1 Tax=Owenia fusiformis TaxID=6347 RepID=A0A8S4NDN9_OWEFU|nr:unnamed protein product [Owenia fusiformis]